MKLLVGIVLAIVFPVFGSTSVAGDWAGVVTLPKGPLHLVLHVTGEDAALKATLDSPDQGVSGIRIASITLSGLTLQFSIPRIDVKFSGDVHSEGSVVGTFSQHGSTVPLIFEAAAALPKSASGATEPAGVLQGNHYHHNLTGVEFDLPAGWSIGRTTPADGDPIEMTVLVDPDRKAHFLSVWMAKWDAPPANLADALSLAVPQLLRRRAGDTAAAPPHLAANYKIRDGSVEQTFIGGQPAVRAIGEYGKGGQKIAELLTWIYTEHTRTYFFAKMAAENLQAVQVPFEQILQSAKIP